MPDTPEDTNEQLRLTLIAAHLGRTQSAADQLRTLLFAYASGGVAFVMSNEGNMIFQSASFVVFVAAIGVLISSWDLQKTKSLRRYRTLKFEGYDAYEKLEKEYEGRQRNWLRDRIVYALIAVGTVSGFLASVFGAKGLATIALAATAP